MMPPTSIDGTDITGATIDGTDVTEITVDGQTVFSAGPSNLPVAYSNLVAWYPFDSATYGGSNADDVTAIIGGSGDDTAYDFTLNGPTYQSSGGVTDINAGANSGAFDFDGSNDEMNNDRPPIVSNDFTVNMWVDYSGNTQAVFIRFFWQYTSGNEGFLFRKGFGADLYYGNNRTTFSGPPTGKNMFTFVYRESSSNYEVYYNANSQGTTGTTGNNGLDSNTFRLGHENSNKFLNGRIDDVRVYNTDLTQSQINQIYQNTQP